MADHVAVGVVDDDQAVFLRIGVEPREDLRRHREGVHLGVRGERGGVEARGDVDLVLAFGRLGGLAVEEARHVAELLRLGSFFLPLVVAFTYISPLRISQ